MNEALFRKLLIALLIIGAISVVVIIIITIVLYNQTSMITYIDKELW